MMQIKRASAWKKKKNNLASRVGKENEFFSQNVSLPITSLHTLSRF